MAFREVAVTEIREVLRAWLAGAGLRRVAAQAGVDRKTARRYVEAAVKAGLARGGGPGQLTDELVGQVAQVVRPVRPGGHGLGWAHLEACRAEIEGQVKAGLSVVKIGVLLERRDFYQLCVERHQRASTVVTSNRTPEEWLSMMADPLLAQSAVDRLVSTAHELIIEGESYRRRQKPAISHHHGTSIDHKNGDHHDHS